MSAARDGRSAVVARVRELHREVAEAAVRLAELHTGRLHCRLGCSDCCQDGLTVFSIEAERIRQDCPEVLLGAKPHAPGACAFLDESNGGCRIYGCRPYVCLTQGLPLRWLEEDEDSTLIEHRAICPVNQEGAPLEELPESALWLIGPFEIRLANLQFEWDGVGEERMALRSLFELERRVGPVDHD